LRAGTVHEARNSNAPDSIVMVFFIGKFLNRKDAKVHKKAA
jgi:hypothetical protein